MTLEALNDLTPEGARETLERCCGASAWIERVSGARPFASRAALDRAAEVAFVSLREHDWREAFAHHPKIGEVQSLREKFASTADWAGAEQSGASGADDATVHALAEANREYEARFGYIFIVCATGKNAAEMLALLRARLPNPPEQELRIAAEEQMKITRLRLQKLIGGAS